MRVKNISDQDYGMHDCYVTWGRTLSAWSLQKNKFRPEWDTCMQKSSVTVHLGEFAFCDAFFMYKYLDFVQLPLDWGERQILWKEKLILIIQTSVTSTLSLVGFASNLLAMYTQGKRRKTPSIGGEHDKSGSRSILFARCCPADGTFCSSSSKSCPPPATMRAGTGKESWTRRGRW